MKARGGRNYSPIEVVGYNVFKGAQKRADQMIGKAATAAKTAPGAIFMRGKRIVKKYGKSKYARQAAGMVANNVLPPAAAKVYNAIDRLYTAGQFAMDSGGKAAGATDIYIETGVSSKQYVQGIGPSEQLPAIVIKRKLKHGITKKQMAIYKLYKPQKCITYASSPIMDKIPACVGYNQVGIWGPYPAPRTVIPTWSGAIQGGSALTEASQDYCYPLAWTMADDALLLQQIGASSTSIGSDVTLLPDGNADYNIAVKSRHISFDLMNANLFTTQKIKIRKLLSLGVNQNSTFLTNIVSVAANPIAAPQSPILDWINPFALNTVAATPIPQATDKMNIGFQTQWNFSTNSYFTGGAAPYLAPNLGSTSWGSTVPYNEIAVFPDAASPKLSPSWKDGWKEVSCDTITLLAGQQLKYSIEQEAPMLSAQEYNSSYSSNVMIPKGYMALLITFESQTGGLIDVWPPTGVTTGVSQYTLQASHLPGRIFVSNIQKYCTVCCKGTLMAQGGIINTGNPSKYVDIDLNQFYSGTYPTVDNTLEQKSYTLLTQLAVPANNQYRISFTTDQNEQYAGSRDDSPKT